MMTDSRDANHASRAGYTLTIADLCQAIASDEITPIVRDGHYQIRGSDIRKLRRMYDLYDAELASMPLVFRSAGSEMSSASGASGASDVGCMA